MSLKSFQFKLFNSFILFGSILFLITLYIVTRVIEDEYLSHKTELFYELILNKDEKISGLQSEIKTKLQVISNSEYINNYTKIEQKENLKNILSPFLLIENSILRISLLDENLNEKFYISKYGDIVNNLKPFDPQKNSEIRFPFVSQFYYDEKLEIPYYQLVFKINGGYMLAHINLKNTIFNTIEKSTYKENWFLVDKDGKFIIHKNGKYNWSSFTNIKYDLKDEFPKDYKNILENELYSNAQMISKKIAFDNGDYAILLLKYKEDFAQQLKDKYNDILLFVVFIGVLVAIFLAFVLSKPFTRINLRLNLLNNNLDKQVKERTKELSTSLDLIDKYIITSKTDDRGKITYVSEAFCKVSGYSKEELIGKPHNIVRDKSNSATLFESLWKSLSKGDSWSGEIKNKTKNGDNYYIYSNINPLYEKGKIIGHMAVAEDITDKKKLEELNEKLEQRVEEEVEKNIAQYNKNIEDRVKSAQLASIGQLAAGITHEINTPLTYIKGNIEMMKYDIEDISDDRIKKNLSEDFTKVDDGLERIEKIVDTMREVSQSSHEGTFEVNVYETLIIALNMIYNRSKQISPIYIKEQLFEIGLEKDEHIFFCKLQKQRVEQLWIVILNNALDVLEKVENYEDRKILVDIKKENQKIVVEIKDNGGGIPQDIIDNIFDPVFSTKKHAGLGVGLNVAKKIVDDQDGNIRAYNKDGGAVFEVSFNVSK